MAGDFDQFAVGERFDFARRLGGGPHSGEEEVRESEGAGFDDEVEAGALFREFVAERDDAFDERADDGVILSSDMRRKSNGGIDPRIAGEAN